MSYFSPELWVICDSGKSIIISELLCGIKLSLWGCCVIRQYSEDMNQPCETANTVFPLSDVRANSFNYLMTSLQRSYISFQPSTFSILHQPSVSEI